MPSAISRQLLAPDQRKWPDGAKTQKTDAPSTRLRAQSVFARDCAAWDGVVSPAFRNLPRRRMPRLREIRASSYSSRMWPFALARVCENAAKRGLSRRIAAAEILTCSNCPAPCRFCTLHGKTSRAGGTGWRAVLFRSTPRFGPAHAVGIPKEQKDALDNLRSSSGFVGAGMVTSYTAAG